MRRLLEGKTFTPVMLLNNSIGSTYQTLSGTT
jgi:hypothetical protein